MAGLRTVGVRLMAEVSGYVAGVRTAARSTRDFAGELDRAARAGNLDAVADQAAQVGLGLVGLAAGAVAMAARFEKAMSAVDAATHASAQEMNLLRQAAIEAGKDTQYSATQAAQGIEELAKAGVATADILGGGLSGALSLAAAGQIDVGEAAETAASALTQFKLEGSDVGHVADLLAAAAGKAQGSVRDMSMALNQSGLVAAQMGLSIEETTGTLASFASAGLLGSDAGTSFKTMLQMLVNPSKESAELMERLGISAFDAQGQFVGMAALAGNLRDALAGLTDQQRNAALAQIFGADAVRAAAIVYQQGQSGIQGWIDKTDAAGYAADTAARKTDNLVGDLERLKGELETLAIQSGSGANEGLRVLAQGAEALVAQFGSLPPAIGGTVTVLAAVTGGLLLMGAGWVKARRATADALEELRNTGPAGTRAAAGLQATTRWAGRAAAAFVALEVGAAAVRAAFGNNLNPQVEALAQGLEKWTATGVKGGEAARLLGKDFEHLAYDLGTLDSGFWAGLGNGVAGVVESFTGLGSVMDESLEHARDRLTALDAALAQMVQSGNADTAARVFAQIAEEAEQQGVSIDELKAGLPQYAGLLETAGAASGEAAAAVGGLGDEAGQAAEQAQELKDAFDRLFDAQMNIDQATIAYKQGLKDLREELNEGRATLNLNTQEGRDNASAVLEQIERIKKLRDTRIEHGMALDEANSKYQTDIAGLRKSMLQAGFTKSAVDELIGSYRRIPDDAETEVAAPGATAAAGQVRNYNFQIGQIRKSKSTTITLAGHREAIARADAIQRAVERITGKTIRIGVLGGRGGFSEFRWGGVVEHAQHGLLREAQVGSPVGPARYAWAEPATGGEAFIPKYGDMDRSRAIWDYVGRSWLGMRPQAGAGGGTVVNIGGVTVNGADRSAVRIGHEVVRQIEEAIGRRANLMARSG